MGLLSWIVLGLIAGFIAQFLVGGGFGLVGTLILGIIGAVVGGFIASALGFGTIDGIDLTSIVIATLGSILVIGIARAAGGGRRVAV
jgi:uncharacterized membrane protein YeaQ/YmgE (transglycosylase-associated protein family)